MNSFPRTHALNTPWGHDMGNSLVIISSHIHPEKPIRWKKRKRKVLLRGWRMKWVSAQKGEHNLIKPMTSIKIYI